MAEEKKEQENQEASEEKMSEESPAELKLGAKEAKKKSSGFCW